MRKKLCGSRFFLFKGPQERNIHKFEYVRKPVCAVGCRSCDDVTYMYSHCPLCIFPDLEDKNIQNVNIAIHMTICLMQRFRKNLHFEIFTSRSNTTAISTRMMLRLVGKLCGGLNIKTNI